MEIVFNAPKLAQFVIDPLWFPVFNVGQHSATPAQPLHVEIGVACRAPRADLDERFKAVFACYCRGWLAFADMLLGFVPLLVQFIQVMVIAMSVECEGRGAKSGLATPGRQA